MYCIWTVTQFCSFASVHGHNGFEMTFNKSITLTIQELQPAYKVLEFIPTVEPAFGHNYLLLKILPHLVPFNLL